jgi:hypothetical protein
MYVFEHSQFYPKTVRLNKPPIGTMPPLSTKTKHYRRERIRSLIVQNPHVSAEGIRKALDAQGLTLDRHYIGKLLTAIHTERAKRADTWTLNMALASFRNAMAEIVRVGWEIANDKFAPGRDRKN